MGDAKTLMSLSLKDEASRQLKTFEGNYKKTIKNVEGTDLDVDASIGKLTSGLGGAGALLGIGGMTAGVAMLGSAINDMATQAGQLQLVRTAFDNLAAGAGQSSDAMLASMRSASQGMVSDYDLILSANKAMMLGVADTGEELSALLEIARSRGAAMGLSLTQAFSDIVTGLGRESALILDNLGIVIDSQAAMDAYAKTLGTTADALDGAQRKQALLNAVMAQTPASSGGASGGVATAAAQAAAAQANAAAKAGEFFAPIVRDANQGTVDLLNALGGTFDEFAVQMREINDLLAGATIPDDMVGRFTDLQNAMTGVGQALAMGVPMADTYANTLGNMADSAILYGQISDQQANSIRTIAALTQDAIKASTAHKAAVDAQTAAYQAQFSPVSYLGDTVRNLTQRQQENKTAAEAAAMGIAGFGRVAAAGAVDVASMEAAVRGLNNAMAGMQPILAGVASMRQSAIGQAESLGLQAIAEGADPAQVAGMVATVTDEVWNLGLSYEATTEAQFANKVLVGQSTSSLSEYVEQLRETNRSASSLASGGLAQVDQALENLRGRVGSVLGESLSLDPIGVNPADFLPRPDAVQEDAFRLADVMVQGFASPWASYFESTFPALFADMTAGGDIQAGAAKVLQEFQQGMRPELLNFDAIKEKVKAALAMDDALAGMRDQITTELTGAGASIEQVKSALNGVLGGAGLGGAAVDAAGGAAGQMTQAITVTPQFDLSAVRAAAEGIGVEFANGMNAPEAANRFSTTFMISMKNFYGRFYASGAASANEWGNGFTAVVEQNVPPYLLQMLVTLVTPGVMARIAAAGTAEGAE
jgi:hypothetical protein